MKKKWGSKIKTKSNDQFKRHTKIRGNARVLLSATTNIFQKTLQTSERNQLLEYVLSKRCLDCVDDLTLQGEKFEKADSPEVAALYYATNLPYLSSRKN